MRWSSHHTSLIVMHQWVCPSSSNASTTKAPILSRLVRAHTYIKYNMWEFWYPYLFGSMGVSIITNPNTFICKIYRIYSIKTKSCKMSFAATMCTCVHSSIQMSVMCISMVCMWCMSWGMCMNMWNLFLAKHGIQSRVIKCTLAQSEAQTINVIFQCTNIFFNLRRSNMRNMRINNLFLFINIFFFIQNNFLFQRFNFI